MLQPRDAFFKGKRNGAEIQRADFDDLKRRLSQGGTPKVTIPSPTMLHFRGGRVGISKTAYPELEPAFYDDVAAAFGEELRSPCNAGCRYAQMDDTNRPTCAATRCARPPASVTTTPTRCRTATTRSSTRSLR